MGGCTGKPAGRSKQYSRNETNYSNNTNNNKCTTHSARITSKKDINAPNSFLEQILRVNGVQESENGAVRECSRRLKEIRQKTLPAYIVPTQVEGRVKLCEINASSILSRRGTSPLKTTNKGSGTESPITSSTDDKDTLTNKQMKISMPIVRQKRQGINSNLSDVKEQQFPQRKEEIHKEISAGRYENSSKEYDSGNCINESVNLKGIYVTSIENSELKMQYQQQLDGNSHIHYRSAELSRRSSPTHTKSKHAPPIKV